MSWRFRVSASTPTAVEVLDHLLDRHLIRPGDLLQNLVERRRLLLDFQPREQAEIVNHLRVAGAAEAMTSTPGRTPPAESDVVWQTPPEPTAPLRRRRHLRRTGLTIRGRSATTSTHS